MSRRRMPRPDLPTVFLILSVVLFVQCASAVGEAAVHDGTFADTRKVGAPGCSVALYQERATVPDTTRGEFACWGGAHVVVQLPPAPPRPAPIQSVQ